MRIYKWLSLLIVMLVGSAFAMGNYGLNKVQYDPFAWKLVQTSHFDIYFYQGGDSLARFTAQNIETLYDSSAAYMHHRLHQRIPVILHNTHAQFEATNVIRYPIPEAVGGFTEVFKNRIVLPFDGSYTSFRHVLQHEMLHAMVFDEVSNGSKGYNTETKLSAMPLWANEGSSEYGSLGWDLGSEFFMLDAVTSGTVTNPAQDLWGYLAYKGGQNFWFYTECVWGKGTVAKIFESIAHGVSFDVAFMRATRVSLEEAGEIWLREIRRIYWPELGARQYAKSIARALTDHRKEENFYNVNPALSPDGKQIAFFSDRGNWEAVYIMDVETEKITQTAIEGGMRASHESFHPFTSALSWAPDNQHILLVSKQAGRDVIHIVDAKKSKVVCTIDPIGLEGVSSPTISPDGKRLVFSGQKNSVQNLYLLELPATLGTQGFPDEISQAPVALTNDHFTEERPVFSPSGRYVAFQTNRDADSTDPFIKDKLDVYLLDLTGHSIRRVSKSRWTSTSPTFGEDDSLIVYISNRSGVDNIYLQNTFGDSTWPLSNVLSAVSSVSWSHTGNEVSFSLFENGGWDVYLMKNPWMHRRFSPLPKTRFMEVAEDTTGTQRFFASPTLENLKTFKSKAFMDSLEQEIRESTGESHKSKEDKPGAQQAVSHQTDEDGFFLDAPARKVKKDSTNAVHMDSTHTDSTHTDTTKIHVVTLQSDTAQKDSTQANSLAVQGDSAHATPSIAQVPSAKDSIKDTTSHQKDAQITPAPGWNPPDTTKIFFTDKNQTAFNDDGSLHIKPYQTDWTLDQAQAVAGFSSTEGVGGQGAVTFSDLMGDQEINFWFFGGGSLDNLSFFLDYGYLPKRLDAHVSVFRNYAEGSETMTQAQYLALHDSIATPGSDTVTGSVPYADQTYGAAVNFSWPLSIFSRIDFGSQLTMRQRTYKNITGSTWDGQEWNYTLSNDTIIKPQNLNTVELFLSWSFDNAQWGVSGPVEGQRLWAGVQGIPPGILQSQYAYWRADADMRKYFRIFQRYTFAFRAAGGISEPIEGYSDPHRYLVGGDDWTLNWHYNADNWHGSQKDVFFGSWETPLRGFAYNEFAGTRMGVVNAEFRFPFIDRLSFGWPIPLNITNVTGVLFTDYGGTWENRDVLSNHGWGYGWGWRLNLGIFVLRYSRAWSVDEYSSHKGGDYTYWSIGAEF